MPDPLIINRQNESTWCATDCHAKCQAERGLPGLAEGPQPDVVFACRCDCHQAHQVTELAAMLGRTPTTSVRITAPQPSGDPEPKASGPLNRAPGGPVSGGEREALEQIVANGDCDCDQWNYACGYCIASAALSGAPADTARAENPDAN